MLLVFLFSIALPGLYLSYVGLRSIVREQELQRGLLIQSVGRSLEFEIESFDERLERSEASIAGKLLSSKVPLHGLALDTPGVLQPWIEHVIVFDSLLNLRSPLPFAADRFARPAAVIKESSLQSRMESAEQLEVQGNPAAALSAYQQLLSEHHSPQSRIVLNTYLARTALALGDHAEARRAYAAIIQADSTFLITRPISYAAFAWLELIDDLIAQGKPGAAAERCLQFHQRLLNFYHHFSREQFDHIQQKLYSLMRSFETSSVLSLTVRNDLSKLEERERRLTRTLGQAEEIQSWLQARRTLFSVPDPGGTVSHHSLLIGEHGTPLSLVYSETPSGLRHWVAFLIRPEVIQRELLLPGLRSGDLAEDFIISIRTDSSEGDRQTELVTSKMHSTAALFPSLAVSVAGKQTSSFELFGVQTSLLSVGLGSLVVGIILLGIFIIYRDIRREEEVSKMKSEFISNVSHELKTPIASIRMLADNLRERRIGSEARRMEYYNLISKEGARLSRLIENILAFSRMEEKRKAFRLERHELSPIVSETVRQFKSLVEERAHDISIDAAGALPEVMIDPDAIALAVFNLIDNAVKYSERNTPVSVRLRRSDSFLCIEVEDHGTGISKSDQEKIFDKFYRVHEHEGKKIPGSGIGLTLVREIAQAHNGRVQVQSRLGEGSTFQLMLPIGG